ncbi:MAG: FG-GAP-like repeat-containing protein [Chloroflexota bacterium]
MADGELLLWGNDNAITATASTDVPASHNQRLLRVWKVQETGDVGTVDISFDLTGLVVLLSITLDDPTGFALLTDSDTTFSDATATIGATVSGNVVTFSGVNLNNGQFFSLGYPATLYAPGGVRKDLDLWLKANDGPDNTTDGGAIATWEDRSGNDYHVSQATASKQPTFRARASDINGQSVVRFDGSDDWIGTNRISVNTDYSIFVMTQHATGSAGEYQSIFNTATSQFVNSSLQIEAGGGAQGCAGEIRFFGSDTGGSLLSPICAGTLTTAPQMRGFIQTAGAIETYLDGIQQSTGTRSFNGGVDAYRLGTNRNTNGSYWNGDIAEIVVYHRALTATERQQVESYFSLKYGVSLSNTNYLNSDGNVIWDATANAPYNNDVAGIGIDADSAFTQTTSSSTSTDDIVTMTGTVAGGMVDGAFLLWGNDNGSTGTGSTDAPSSYDLRVLRVWKVQETGDVGTVDISFDLTGLVTPLGVDLANTAGFALLTDSADATLNDATATTGATVNGNVVTFSGVNLANGQFFGLAYPVTSDLVMVKSVYPASAAASEAITYTLAFSNIGIGTATGVVITDSVPAIVTNISISSSGLAVTNIGVAPNYVWQVADMTPGTSGLIRITGTLSPTATGMLTNTAIINFTHTDADVSNNTSAITVTVIPPGTFTLGTGFGNENTLGMKLGDFDGDGDFDAFLGNDTLSNTVWLNNGDGTFTDSGQALGVSYPNNVDVGDLDGDGDLDLVVSHATNPPKTDNIWLNDGTGVFADSGRLPPGITTYGVEVGDLDNDGDLDIFYSTRDAGQGNFVFFNDGGGNWTSSQQTYVSSFSNDVELGDLDNDGDLDVIVADTTGSKVWRNDGTGTFALLQSIGPPQHYDAMLGDLDGDGDLDIFASTSVGGQVWLNDGNASFTDNGSFIGSGEFKRAMLGDTDGDGDLDAIVLRGTAEDQVWTNDGAGNFTAYTEYNDNDGNSQHTDVDFGDLDGDGDLDALVSSNQNGLNTVWLGSTPANNAPTAPSGLTSVVSGSTVTLTWTAGSDTETSANMLTYNVRVGTTSGGNEIRPSMSTAAGARQITAMGNAGTRLSTTLNLNTSGTYYWSVQAVDSGYAGSTFAPEQSFSVVIPCSGSSLIVDSTADTDDYIYSAGQNTLREAIACANAGDTITFDASISGQTITLSDGFTLTNDLTISGTVPVVISGNNTPADVFAILAGTVTLDGLTIANSGQRGVDISAGAVVTIKNSAIQNNAGNGIYSLGDLTVRYSTITGSGAQGLNVRGGVFYLYASTVSNNSTGGSGGGLYIQGTTSATIDSSTIANNTSGNRGGGVSLNTGSFTIQNSTIYNNTSTKQGGGVSSGSPSVTLTLKNTTISDNKSLQPNAGGLYNRGTAHLYNTIIANHPSSAGGDCLHGSGGTFGTVQKVLIEDGSCSQTYTGDPNLGPLQDNGGNIFTMLPGAGSTAIDNGNNANCLSVDQRGVARPVNGTCDIGAVEQ